MSSLIILTSSAPNLGPGLAATHEREGRKERLGCQLLESQPGAASRGHVFPASWLLNQGELVFKTSKCVFAKEMGQAENGDVEPELGKSPNVDQSLGVWRGLRNRAAPGFSAAGFLFKVHSLQGVSPWGCAAGPGRGLVGVVAAAHLPPTGQAIAGRRHGPWKGLSSTVLTSVSWRLSLPLEELNCF